MKKLIFGVAIFMALVIPTIPAQAVSRSVGPTISTNQNTLPIRCQKALYRNDLFPDKNLKDAVYKAAGYGSIFSSSYTPYGPSVVRTDLERLTVEDLLGIKEIYVRYSFNLKDIDCLVNLESFSGDHLSTGNYSYLSNNTKLKRISTAFSGDENVDGLTNITSLESFGSSFGNLTNLEGLKNNRDMKWVSVTSGPLVDVSVLSNFKKLTSITLYNTHVTDITSLRKLRNLEAVKLNGSRVTNLTPIALNHYIDSKTTINLMLPSYMNGLTDEVVEKYLSDVELMRSRGATVNLGGFAM